jgi:hypothetical protein
MDPIKSLHKSLNQHPSPHIQIQWLLPTLVSVSLCTVLDVLTIPNALLQISSRTMALRLSSTLATVRLSFLNICYLVPHRSL